MREKAIALVKMLKPRKTCGNGICEYCTETHKCSLGYCKYDVEKAEIILEK
jgi:hypothetical protein